MSDTAPSAEDEFTQSFLDALESRFPVSSAEPSPETDPAAPGGDEPPSEGEEPSSPETEPSPEPEPEPEPAPDEGGAPEEGHGQPASAFTLSGVDYSSEQVSRALQVASWFDRLNPQEVQAIDALMSGQYTLSPLQPQPQPSPGGQPAPSPSSVQPPPAAEDEGDWLDPRAQTEIRALRAQINDLTESFKASLGPVVQTQQQADYQARLTQINKAHADFQARYQLDDNAMNALETSIAQAQVLPGLAQREGSIEKGMNTALEMMFWTTPTYRDAWQAQRTTSLQAEQAAEEQATIRKQHLTALSGSGGSAPRREPVPSSPEDRHQAMVQEIAAAMNGSGQVE